MTKPYYADDSVTLFHGDCREVLPNLEAVDLVLTDPPYGINYVSNYSVGRGARPITNDGARLAVALQRAVIPMLRANHVLWFTRWDVVAGCVDGARAMVPAARHARVGQERPWHGRPKSLGTVLRADSVCRLGKDHWRARSERLALPEACRVDAIPSQCQRPSARVASRPEGSTDPEPRPYEVVLSPDELED
jgi:hypothetical protein